MSCSLHPVDSCDAVQLKYSTSTILRFPYEEKGLCSQNPNQSPLFQALRCINRKKDYNSVQFQQNNHLDHSTNCSCLLILELVCFSITRPGLKHKMYLIERAHIIKNQSQNSATPFTHCPPIKTYITVSITSQTARYLYQLMEVSLSGLNFPW